MQIIRLLTILNMFYLVSGYRMSTVAQTVPKIKTNFGGRVLRISLATAVPSRIALTKTDQIHNFQRGAYMHLIQEFESKLNFTTIPFPSIGGGGSGNLKNGSWSGAIGDVISGRADIGFCAGINVLRYQYVDIAGIMEFMVLSYATGKPAPEFTWKAVFSPFAPFVWLAIGISVFLGFATLFLLTNGKHSDNLALFEFVFSAFFENGTRPSGLQRKVKAKFFLGLWSILGLVLGTAYKCKIVELLAFPLYPEVPKDFDELSLRDDYNWGLQFYGGLAYDLFRLSTNPTMIRIFNKMELEPDAIKCFSRSKSSKFACITYSTLAEFAILKDFTNRFGQSDLKIAEKSREFFVAVGPVVRKGSELQVPFEWALGRTVDAGLFDQWKRMDYEEVRRAKFKNKSLKEDNASVFEESDEIVLTLRNLKGAFVVLFIGAGISSILYFGEMYFPKLGMYWMYWDVLDVLGCIGCRCFFLCKLKL